MSRAETAGKVRRWLQDPRDTPPVVRLELAPQARSLAVHRAGAPARCLGPGDSLALEDLLPGLSVLLERVLS